MRMVMCSRLKREAIGFDKAPFPGRVGQMIFDKVSQEAFEDWKGMQTKIVNEYRLDLSEANDRQVLMEQMMAFLGLAEGETMQVGTPDHEGHQHGGHGGGCC